MAVASRWPQRFSPAALISFSISRSVRYSRGRVGRLTVTFTAIGACIPRAVFSIVSRNVGLKLLRFCTCNSMDVHLGQKPGDGRAQGNVCFTQERTLFGVISRSRARADLSPERVAYGATGSCSDRRIVKALRRRPQ